MVFLAGAIALNVGVVYWALDRDASIKGYGLQLMTALGIGLIAGFLITAVSWLLLELVFPSSIAEMRAAAIAWMEGRNLPQEEYRRQLTALENTTAWSQSLPGFFGTLATSLVSGAVIAIFKRRR
jgi:hypothetical protein